MTTKICEEVPNCILLKDHEGYHTIIKRTESKTNWLHDMWLKVRNAD